MLFTIHTDAAVPIYEQIVAQVIYGVAAGTLQVGELIPSVRELAETLLVHPNTVARAFQELEREGILTVRRGVGMEVTAGAQSACRTKRQNLVRQRIRHALREAAGSALSAEEIQKLVDEELAAVNGKRNTKAKG